MTILKLATFYPMPPRQSSILKRLYHGRKQIRIGKLFLIKEGIETWSSGWSKLITFMIGNFHPWYFPRINCVFQKINFEIRFCGYLQNEHL